MDADYHCNWEHLRDTTTGETTKDKNATMWRDLKNKGVSVVESAVEDKKLIRCPLTYEQARECIRFPEGYDQLCVICAKWCVGLGHCDRFNTGDHRLAACDPCTNSVLETTTRERVLMTFLFADGSVVCTDNGNWGHRENA